MRPKPAPAYLELPRPQMSGRIVDERAREVALHPADEVVVLRVRALPDKRGRAGRGFSAPFGAPPLGARQEGCQVLTR